ncbi:MAG: OmpA family protein [Alphaproteobacteria bacterium]|nr:OmpA family protein [Alphaproteobacteria bacterium]
MLRQNRFVMLAGLIGLLPLSAQAGDAVLLENDASRCEIFRAISPDVPDECSRGIQNGPIGLGKARGIRIHGNDQGLAETDAGRPNVESEPQSFSIAMRIQFMFDSAELTPESKTTLGQIAQVLQDDLMQDKTILLEGHADATGSEDYNRHLSERRAGSVRQYLMSAYGVPGERLHAVGRGEQEPFDASDPQAPVNRRVEFTNLSD